MRRTARNCFSFFSLPRPWQQATKTTLFRSYRCLPRAAPRHFGSTARLHSATLRGRGCVAVAVATLLGQPAVAAATTTKHRSKPSDSGEQFGFFSPSSPPPHYHRRPKKQKIIFPPFICSRWRMAECGVAAHRRRRLGGYNLFFFLRPRYLSPLPFSVVRFEGRVDVVHPFISTVGRKEARQLLLFPQTAARSLVTKAKKKNIPPPRRYPYRRRVRDHGASFGASRSLFAGSLLLLCSFVSACSTSRTSVRVALPPPPSFFAYRQR
jgi:hypothetical protein